MFCQRTFEIQSTRAQTPPALEIGSNAQGIRLYIANCFHHPKSKMPLQPLRIVILLTLLMVLACLTAQAQDDEAPDWQPLLVKHFSQSDLDAASKGLDLATYMTEKERNVLAYTNLARLFPLQFDAFYLDWLENVEDDEGWEKYAANDHFYTTLHKDLQKMKPLAPLRPSKKYFVAAEQWAKYSGKNGLLGHNRPWYMRNTQAECCAYNPLDDPMTLVLDLLIDEKVKSLGHRKILLGKWLDCGASIQPHKTYGWCLVMDFGGE